MLMEIASHFGVKGKIHQNLCDVRKATKMTTMLRRTELGIQIQSRTSCQMWMDGEVPRPFTQMNMTLLQRALGRLTPSPGFHLILLKGGGRQRPPLPLPSTRKVCAVFV